MMNRREFGKLLGLGSLGAILANAPATMAQDGNVLRLATPVTDLQTLNPHYAVGTQDRTVVAMVFNGLIRTTPGTEDQFEPDLAEEMPEAVENDDGTQTWTFVLREGVMTHPVEGVDSAELTVNDVKFSFENSADVNSSGFSGDYTDWIFEADEETREFRITVPDPISTLLFYPKVANYSGGFIIPQAPFEALGPEAFATHPVGTGPFMYSEYTPQVEIKLAAHQDFYRGAPQLAGVDVVYLADHTARDFALESGDVHVIHGQWQSAWVERMNATDGLAADVFGVGDQVFFCFDTQHEILQDIRIREAIILAMSREGHVQIAGEPVFMPMHGINAADHLPGGVSKEEAEAAGVYFLQDIERSKELLAEAGYADGFELDLISSEMEIYRVNYEVLQEELRQVGITVNLEIVQHATMHELIRQGRNPITIYSAYRPNPDIHLTHFFTSDSGGANFSNMNMDELRDQARAETDPDAQIELWKQASIEIMQNYAAYAPMYMNQVYARMETVDYGHELLGDLNYYPGINETTTMSTDE